MDFLTGVALILLVYIAWRVHEANTRLKILDMRMRVLEQFVAQPELTKSYKAVYDSVFGEIYVGDYNRLLKFGRQHGLQLPILTMEEEKTKPKIVDDLSD